MALKDILSEITADVADVSKTTFSYVSTQDVPNSHTQGLTFERGKQKAGKEIETCVLYVDIRNSVALTKKHQSISMAKIYTAFIKAVIKAGRHHQASTRNIIGDRVMLVFPAKGCFYNAISCAISINHIARNIIAPLFPDVEFKCGIGVDYGKLKVIKVGIQRNGTEQSENKGLVWTGYPANIASRLTDLANKKVENVSFKLNYNAKRSPLWDASLRSGIYGLKRPNLLDAIKNSGTGPYYPYPREEEWDAEKFAAAIEFNDGQLVFKNGQLNSMEKITSKISYPPILITEAVLTGLRAENSDLGKTWLQQKVKIKDVTDKVYGGNSYWTF
jgi:adenylate cyclase